MALPPKCEQFARTERVCHIQLQRNPVAKIEPRQGCSKLLPGKHRLIGLPQVGGSLQRASRVLRQELLINRLGKDGLRVRSDLQHPVLRTSLRQLIEMGLESELINVLEACIPEHVDKICLNEELLRKPLY